MKLTGRLNMQANSNAESISSFMRWISDKLDEEVEHIERCEAEFGVEEVYSEELENKPNNLTDEQKIKFVNNVNDIYDSNPNMARTEACREAGIHYTTYYKWRKLL
jgi:hypothetical protein|tara:strand:+ start:337 stop:654 length:318 start_codon:yes stop_codon:yes gene_type:complete